MPTFPGVSASMPSKVHPEDNELMYDFLTANFLEEIDNYNFVLGQELFNNFDHEPFLYDDGQPDNGVSATFNLPNEQKHECLLGKPVDQCLRECGVDCVVQVTRHCRCTCGNMSMAHDCDYEEALRLAKNPQPSLPYSPYNDHSYHQPIDVPKSGSKQTSSDSLESESLTDGDSSADDEIDVVTITDIKVEPPKAKTVRRRGRKPAPKLKFSNSKSLSSKRTSIKKRGRSLQQRPAMRMKCAKPRSLEPSSSSSRSSSDNEELGKRHNHNDMERLRRDEQKNMLHTLRFLVPTIKDNPKASKVSILREAAKHVAKLVKQEARNDKEKRTAEQKKAILQRRLEELKKQMGQQ